MCTLFLHKSIFQQCNGGPALFSDGATQTRQRFMCRWHVPHLISHWLFYLLWFVGSVFQYLSSSAHLLSCSICAAAVCEEYFSLCDALSVGIFQTFVQFKMLEKFAHVRHLCHREFFSISFTPLSWGHVSIKHVVGNDSKKDSFFVIHLCSLEYILC